MTIIWGTTPDFFLSPSLNVISCLYKRLETYFLIYRGISSNIFCLNKQLFHLIMFCNFVWPQLKNDTSPCVHQSLAAFELTAVGLLAHVVRLLPIKSDQTTPHLMKQISLIRTECITTLPSLLQGRQCQRTALVQTETLKKILEGLP